MGRNFLKLSGSKIALRGLSNPRFWPGSGDPGRAKLTPLKKACSEARPRADFRPRGRLRELFSVDSKLDLLKLVLALVIFAVVFFTSAGRVVTDSVEMAAGRVYASPDGVSASWEQGGGTNGLIIYSLASHPGSPRIYAGLWGDGVYRSPSGSNSWSLTSLMAPLQIASLAIDPANPTNVVHAGAIGSGVLRSDNGFDSWAYTTGLEGEDVWSLAVTSTADPIYAYAGAGGGIYISINGTNWNLAGGAGIGTGKFYALVVDPQDSRTVYVGTKEKGVHRTADGGISWTPRGLDTKTVRALALHPDNSEIIYAGTESYGIFKSADGGDTWPVSGLDEYGVLSIAINPRNPEFIYAGTFGDGVWASHDGGHNWHEMPGLTGGAALVYSLTLFTPEAEDDYQVLYAGTTDGVWARTVTSFYTLYLPLVHKG